MEVWKEYKLGEVCTKIGSGATPKGGKESYLGGNISLIRSQNVLDFTFSNDGLAYISDEQANKLKNVEVKENDVLLNITGDSVARACIVPNAILPARVNQHVAIIRGNESLILNKFILYGLQYKKQYLLSISQGGGTRNALTKKMIEDFIINLPSLPTQQKIANILSSLDDKIEVNRRINEQLEELVQALFKSWFVDFEPFKDGEFVESELGMIPEGWKVGIFSDVVDSTLGGDWGKETEQGNYTKEVFCIRGADIPEIKNGNRGKMPIRFILQKNYEKKSLNNNDLVVEISGGSPTQSTGRICRVTSELLEKYNNSLICTNFCRAIKPLAKYSAYIYYYWQYLYDKGAMFNYENGTTGIKNLMINDILEKEPIIIPSIDVVEQYNNVVETFAIKIQKNGEEIEKLSNLRDTLLPKLMSGEIDVNEVEI